MILIDNTNNNDLKNIVSESKFVLYYNIHNYNYTKHDKNIGTGLLIR